MYNNILKTFATTIFQLNKPQYYLKRFKVTLDYTNYPVLNENELEETFIRGSGPGGQAVNKTSNAVELRHLPTNIIVKCHMHRSASRNRIEARKILLEKLDNHFNGDKSIAKQMKTISAKKTAERQRRQQKLKQLKNEWLTREDMQNKDT